MGLGSTLEILLARWARLYISDLSTPGLSIQTVSGFQSSVVDFPHTYFSQMHSDFLRESSSQLSDITYQINNLTDAGLNIFNTELQHSC